MKKTHSDNYRNYIKSPHWRKKSKWVRGLTKGRCSFFPFLPAQETHHLTYYIFLNMGWNSFGSELPVIHLVPLSRFAHKIVHLPFFWKQPIRFLVNNYLRVSFIIIWSISNLLFFVAFGIAIYYLFVN